MFGGEAKDWLFVFSFFELTAGTSKLVSLSQQYASANTLELCLMHGQPVSDNSGTGELLSVLLFRLFCGEAIS